MNKILCAAVAFVAFQNDTPVIVVPGARHADCFRLIRQVELEHTGLKEVQGFIDTAGQFHNRTEALEIAKNCGQLNQTTLWDIEDREQTELFSEDLY